MKKILYVSAAFLLLPFTVGAQTSTTTPPAAVVAPLPDPGLVPGDFFYFLDRFGEGFHFFYTTKSESRARLALQYAAERAAEVSAVLKTKGADSKEVADAKAGFDRELSRASDAMLEAKQKGSDVSASAREIDTRSEGVKDMLKGVYHTYHEGLKSEDGQLRASLAKAPESEKAHIEDILNRHAEEMNAIGDDEDSLDNGFEAEKNKLEEAMGEQQSAENQITNAKRARIQFVAESKVRGIATSTAITEALASFDELVLKASAAYGVKDFENAKEYAKEAKQALNDARNEVDSESIERSFFEDGNESQMEGSKKMSPEEFERQGGAGNPAHIEGSERSELE